MIRNLNAAARHMAAGLMKMGITRKAAPMFRKLNEASQDVEKSQLRVLQRILEYAGPTDFGKQHSFNSIVNPREYARAVAVHSYEDLRPWVERHERGESDVLFPGKPMFYATTSGTTAAPKRIPITRRYHDECYNGLTNLWLSSMFEQNPGFMNGFDISMVGKAIEGYTPDGTSYGSFSGHMNAYMPEFIKKFRVIPFEIHDIDHYPSRYYALMRMALEVPIRWIVAANPSTLLELHRFTVANFDEMVKDIFDGTLKPDLEISSFIRERIERRLRPNPKRSRELEVLFQQLGQDFRPRHYWPSLQVINTWKSGNAGLYLQQTEGYYPAHTIIREFGYLATEARAGIVLKNDQQTSILAAHLLYFEFVHKSELDSDHPNYLQAHELETNEEYAIYITTPSGLYRYNINDIIRVEGFYGTFPMVRFVQKGSGVTSLTGEKLYESQYLSAFTQATAEDSAYIGFHIAFADLARSQYHCFVEFTGFDPVSDQRILELSDRLDLALQNQNPEYAAKRKSNRLHSIEIHPLQEGSFYSYKNHRIEQGSREGQFKLTHLQQNDEQLAVFWNLCRHHKHMHGEKPL